MKRIVPLIAALLLVSACQSTPATPTPSRPALTNVALPDLTNAAESVQTQVRTRYAAMTAAIDKPDTSAQMLADAYGEMGKLFIATEYYDAAKACLDNAALLAPSDMRWPYYLGHVFRLKNDPANAARAFERARAIKGDDVPTLVWLAEMHLTLNEPKAAEAPLAKARVLRPDEGSVLYGLGRVALAQHNYADAVANLERALAAAPQATSIHYQLALAYRGLGRNEEAVAQLRLRGEGELTPADPLMGEIAGLLQNAAAFEARGSKALEDKDWSEAVAQLSKAITLAPNNAATRLNLGTAYYMQGDADRAMGQYREAIRLSPSFARAHFVLGLLLETRGDDRGAIDEFTSTVGADPKNLDARFSLANALRRNGRIEESLPHYDAIVRADPSVSQASFGYAMGLVRLGRYREARERLEAAVTAFPDQPGLAHALARVLAAAPDNRVRDGRRAAAIVSALMKTQRSASLIETMAMTQAELGRFDEAVRWQRQAIDLAQQSGRADMKQLTETLQLYESRRPCRTPWPDDDPVHHPRPQ
ncbi:MAG TPA: tetratricopeptide repeat protein [Vicinamibacterales bacterium]